MTDFWIVFIFLLAFSGMSIVIWTIRNGISPMPTSTKVKRALFQALPETMEGEIYELGSGWGTLARALAQKYPEGQVIGCETSPIPYWVSLISAKPNITYLKKDLFQVDLAKAKMVVCYLYPACMARLKTKLEQELTKDCLVVSHTFSIPGWKAQKIVEVDDLYKTKIYFYQLPTFLQG